MKAFLLWVIKNVRFAALIIAGIILGTCFIKMWHYGDVFSTEYLIVYINSNAAYANVWQEVLSYRLTVIYNDRSLYVSLFSKQN